MSYLDGGSGWGGKGDRGCRCRGQSQEKERATDKRYFWKTQDDLRGKQKILKKREEHNQKNKGDCGRFRSGSGGNSGGFTDGGRQLTCSDRFRNGTGRPKQVVSRGVIKKERGGKADS